MILVLASGHYETVTLVAGLRRCGLVAQNVFNQPINAAWFEEWVEKCLVLTLPKADIVVMDNLSSHRGPRVEQLIKAARAELRYLPPCSPDINPIEKAYSKLKAFLRKIAKRTVAGLLIALDACVDIFKPAEYVNYFKACGYDSGIPPTIQFARRPLNGDFVQSSDALAPTIMIVGDSLTAGYFAPMALEHAGRDAWLNHRHCGFDWKAIDWILICDSGIQPVDFAR